MYNYPYRNKGKGHKKNLVTAQTTRGLFYQFPLEKRKDLKEKQFFGFLKTFYYKIGNEIIENNWSYPLGYNCGSLEIKKREAAYMINPLTETGEVNMKGRSINWSATKKLWKERADLTNKIFLYNDRTDWIYNLVWKKSKKSTINIDIYSVRWCKRFTARLYKAADNGKDYFTKKQYLV